MRRGTVQSLRPLVSLAAAVVLSTSTARAAPCGRPDLIETVPPDGASAVPTNAVLSAHYAQSAEYINETVSFEHIGVGEETPPAMFDANEGLLTIQPPAPLVPNDSYKIRWPALRGIATATLGKGADVQFTAGPTDDADPPTFAGVRSMDWDVDRETDECTDSPEDRYVFDIKLDEPSDDGGRDLLTLVVFQTVGPKGARSASPEPVLVQRFPPKGESVQVRRSIDAAVGHVCFAALARDSVGHISSSADREVCAKTVRPPFFYGCSLVQGSTPTRSGEVSSAHALALLMGAWVLRSSRERRPRG
jgi:hypothetical protein